MENKIIVVGIGPGAVDYIIPKALKEINGAKVLVGGKRALATFANKEKEQILIPIGRDIEGVLREIKRKLEHFSVVVMVSGDPGYYSLLDALKRSFNRDILEVIPGLSSLQVAFSKLALPWHQAKLLSFHGRVPKEQELIYQRGSLIGLLTDKIHNPQKIARLFLELGWPAESEMYICNRLSYPDEEIKLMSLAEGARHNRIYENCVVVVKDNGEKY